MHAASPSSFPRRRKSSAPASPVLSVPLHGSPAFAEDDKGEGGMLEQKKGRHFRAGGPPLHLQQKKGDPKIPLTKVMVRNSFRFIETTEPYRGLSC
jgi:hypothetical protein